MNLADLKNAYYMRLNVKEVLENEMIEINKKPLKTFKDIDRLLKVVAAIEKAEDAEILAKTRLERIESLILKG